MDLLRAWFEAATEHRPDTLEVWDAHTHTGDRDPDGIRQTAEELTGKLKAADHASAIVMTNHDLGGYPGPNDRILAEAQAAEGLLIPFLRVDPRLGSEAVAEAERSFDAGHRGMKLHPRAEQFRLSDPTVRELAHVAVERGAPVLVHAGRGVPSLGRDAVRLCDEIDGLHLILAHCAISDLSWLGPAIENHPGLYVDTAWWDMTDLLALMAWVPPGRIVYASDTPYGHPQLALTLCMRAAIAAGYGAAELTGLFGGTMRALLDGTDPPHLGPAPGDEFLMHDTGLLRVHACLHGAIVRAFTRDDVTEQVSLARLACEVPPDAEYAAVFAAIRTTLEAMDLAGSRSQIVRPLILAAAAALTPQAGAPAV